MNSKMEMRMQDCNEKNALLSSVNQTGKVHFEGINGFGIFSWG